jgi:hypothetical protein
VYAYVSIRFLSKKTGPDLPSDDWQGLMGNEDEREWRFCSIFWDWALIKRVLNTHILCWAYLVSLRRSHGFILLAISSHRTLDVEHFPYYLNIVELAWLYNCASCVIRRNRLFKFIERVDLMLCVLTTSKTTNS